MGDFDPRRKILGRAFEETQRGAFEAGRDDAQTALFTNRDDLCRYIAVGIDNGGLAWGKQAVEQLQFRGEIVFQRCGIVEGVAREIGKGSGTEVDAVEPALQNAVRGGLQGEMGDSAAR